MGTLTPEILCVKQPVKFFLLLLITEASRGSGAQSVTVKSTVSIPTRVKTKYIFTFIFSFIRSGVEAKRGVEYRHSTRNASRTRRKVGKRRVLTLGSLCLPCYVRDSACQYVYCNICSVWIFVQKLVQAHMEKYLLIRPY